MKIFTSALLFLAIAAPFASIADTPPPTPAPSESQLIEHGSYINQDGVRVHSPAHTKTGEVPVGASAKCRDGTYSFSKHHQGTCSHHGGVLNWLD